MPELELPDVRINYDSAGTTGTSVLLVMGFGVPGDMWANQVPALSTRHRVAWFDNCGAGQTKSKRGRYTMSDFSRHAIAVMDELGWDDAHVVGVSMGGMIAQEIALSFKHRVRSLSLVVTHPGGLRHTIPPMRSLALFAAGFMGPRRLRARSLERLIFPDEYLRGRDVTLLRKALEERVTDAAPRSDRLRQIAAVLRHRAGPRLHLLANTPTLIVKASKDRLVRPKASHVLQAKIPGAKLVEFPDAGHAILLQCADRLNSVLLDHFADADEKKSEAA